MKGRFRIGKILAVIFLTLLIWVWADLAQDEKLSITNAEIIIAKNISPELWVSFQDGSLDYQLEEIIAKGAASKVSEVRRGLNSGTINFDFYLNPEKEDAFSSDGELNVLNFIEDSEVFKQYGLAVEAVNPETINLRVENLVEKELKVNVIDEDGNPVKVLSIDPATVNMYVPEDWSGERLQATVMMTRREIGQARYSPIEKTPYVILEGGLRKNAAEAVKIKTAAEEDTLDEYVITTGKLGICLSANLQGKYKVTVENLNKVIQSISIRATAEAKRAYENRLYQVILEIADDDLRAEYPRRLIRYNFPKEYVEEGEIILNQQPVMAQFKLEPVTEADLQAGQ